MAAEEDRCFRLRSKLCQKQSRRPERDQTDKRPTGAPESKEAAWGTGKGRNKVTRFMGGHTGLAIRLRRLQWSKAGRDSGLWLSDSGAASAPLPPPHLGRPSAEQDGEAPGRGATR